MGLASCFDLSLGPWLKKKVEINWTEKKCVAQDTCGVAWKRPGGAELPRRGARGGLAAPSASRGQARTSLIYFLPSSSTLLQMISLLVTTRICWLKPHESKTPSGKGECSVLLAMLYTPTMNTVARFQSAIFKTIFSGSCYWPDMH